MAPGRTGGTGTDGGGPLEHSVMKRSTQNSLILRAFQMNPVRVLCLIYFGNLHLIVVFWFFFVCFFTYTNCIVTDVIVQLYLFADKYSKR